MTSNRPKYLFICGLHRSGTTVLAKNILSLKDCTGFENTQAVMDEGQFLQEVYPNDEFYGGPGRFGFAPGAHLTEDSPLLTPANISRLRESWECYWDQEKGIRVEKTPGNLLMTRFLQTAFPDSYFVVIKRHPVPVSLSTQNWTLTPLHKLFEHWLRCHEIFDEDKKHLKHLYEVSYEDFINDPERHIKEIASFVGTEVAAPPQKQVVDRHNQKYFDRWVRKLQLGPFKIYYRRLTKDFEFRFAQYGYSLESLAPAAELSLNAGTPFRPRFSPVLYFLADLESFRARKERSTRIWIRGVWDDLCPSSVRSLIRKLKARVRKWGGMNSGSSATSLGSKVQQ